MYEANVLGTESVLRRGARGEDPEGRLRLDRRRLRQHRTARSSTRPTSTPATSFTSYYEQTKYEAHQIAKRLIAEEGLPCVIVQPGGVYGPDDHSALGNQINQFLAGKMPMIAFPDLGMNMVHVEDVADGILLASTRARPARPTCSAARSRRCAS